jgi:Bacterial PH domain
VNTSQPNHSSRPEDFFEIFSSASLKKKSEINTPTQAKQTVPSNRNVKKEIVADLAYQEIYEELHETDPNEAIIWMGRSSQAIHFVAYIICFLFFWLIFPLIIAYYLYLSTKRTIYVLTNQRLRVYSGIFIRRIDDLELYRVKDTVFLQSFLLGLFNCSNIQLFTSDATWGDSSIPGIENGRALREKIRKVVEINREHKGVSEVDYYATAAPIPLR